MGGAQYMTPKIIELQQAPVVLVELPEIDGIWQTVYKNEADTRGLIISKEAKHLDTFGENSNPRYVFDLPHGKLTLTGVLSDLTEEQFAEWAVKYPGNATPQRYVNHTHKEKSTGMQVARVSYPSTYRASDSCLSLLESENVYLENPHGEEPTTENTPNYGYSIHVKQWGQAQSRAINPKRTVVLIRKESK